MLNKILSLIFLLVVFLLFLTISNSKVLAELNKLPTTCEINDTNISVGGTSGGGSNY